MLSGPEYLTLFNGQTGAESATVNFEVPRGTVSSWGDSYGNRVDRFLATAAYVDSTGLPSFIMARGYYTRTTMAAWNWRGGQLTRLWQFDSNVTPRDAANHPYTGQGSHSMTIANVDDDAEQEIMYGGMAVDNTGAGLCSTGFNHGDAEHVGDLIPSRPGLEMFMCNEDGAHPSYHIRDARTCANIQSGPINGADTGRCVAGDIDASNPGAEMWASSVDGLFSATTNANLGTKPGSQNFLVWWDADETRELEDSNHIDKYGNGTTSRLLTASGVTSNNGTKSTPALTADLFGDWREEVVWRETNSSALQIYTTTAVTTRRIYTLMHDAQYRVQVSGEQTAYNQPPHPSFHIGNGMAESAEAGYHGEVAGGGGATPLPSNRLRSLRLWRRGGRGSGTCSNSPRASARRGSATSAGAAELRARPTPFPLGCGGTCATAPWGRRGRNERPVVRAIGPLRLLLRYAASPPRAPSRQCRHVPGISGSRELSQPSTLHG